VLDVEAVDMDLEASEGAEKMVIDVLTQLLHLGVYIHKFGKVRCRVVFLFTSLVLVCIKSCLID